MATERTYMSMSGEVIHLTENKEFMSRDGAVVSENLFAAPPSGFQAAWAINSNTIIGMNQ